MKLKCPNCGGKMNETKKRYIAGNAPMQSKSNTCDMAFWRTQPRPGNPYVYAPQSDSIGGRKLARLFREYRKIDRAVAYVAETGLCPVCRTSKSGHGVTCGSPQCVKQWLFPHVEYERVVALEDGVT